MDSSAELRANVLEVSYHHQQQKDSFRLDRIDEVRHHIADPVPGNTFADVTDDDGFFGIATKIYPKVQHRRHLTSGELIAEAKKGNIIRPRRPVLPILETEKHVRFDNAGSEEVSTASAQDSVASGVTTHASVRSSTKSSMPCKQRRNLARALKHAEKRKLSSIDDDISLKGDSMETEVSQSPCMQHSVQRRKFAVPQ